MDYKDVLWMEVVMAAVDFRLLVLSGTVAPSLTDDAVRGECRSYVTT